MARSTPPKAALGDPPPRRPRLTRRDLLRRAAFGAAGVLAAPYVDLLMGDASRRARAATVGHARRLVVFFTPNGTVPSHWPTGSPDAWSFPAGSAFEPLAPLKDELLIVKGLDFHAATNHEGGMGACLTANGGPGDVGGGMSVDQFVAASLPGEWKFQSLELGARTSQWGGSVQTRLSYSGPGSFVTPDDDPLSTYKRLFGDVGASAEDQLKLQARRLSVLDLARTELQTLHGRLGAAERDKLDAHLASLGSVEASLTMGSGGCEPPLPPEPGNIADNARFPEIVQQQIDLGTLALACGMTPVLTLQMSHTVSPVAFTWLDIADGHHALSHSANADTEGVAKFIACERWFSERFVHLVERLKSLPDPETGGSLYDDTLVVWAKEMGDARAHVCTDVPLLVAGGGAGFFRQGAFVDLGGVHHARMLTHLAQCMGVDVERFGDAKADMGDLSEVLA